VSPAGESNDEGSSDGKEPWEVPDPRLFDAGASVVKEEPDSPSVTYDLEERTARFGEAVIDLCAGIPLGPRTNRLIDQLTGSATSIGANYVEADDALSKKDFAKTIGICRKEARETKFFPRMIARACPDLKPSLRPLWQEANELHLIFSKIRRTCTNAT
jgi:four helix bundle protein